MPLSRGYDARRSSHAPVGSPPIILSRAADTCIDWQDACTFASCPTDQLRRPQPPLGRSLVEASAAASAVVCVDGWAAVGARVDARGTSMIVLVDGPGGATFQPSSRRALRVCARQIHTMQVACGLPWGDCLDHVLDCAGAVVRQGVDSLNRVIWVRIVDLANRTPQRGRRLSVSGQSRQPPHRIWSIGSGYLSALWFLPVLQENATPTVHQRGVAVLCYLLTVSSRDVALCLQRFTALRGLHGGGVILRY